MPEPTNRKSLTSVERAIDILLLFSEHERADLGVTQIAEQMDFSKSVVHRSLTSLTSRGLLEIDERTHRYRLGHSALRLGSAFLEHLDLRDIARPFLDEASRMTGETSTLSLRNGWLRTYVDQVTPPREVRMTVQLGRSFPLHAGSSSKAFLAFLPTAEQERYVSQSELEALTPVTIVDPDALRRELDEIRNRGYASSLGERQAGAGSVAAPIRDHRGDVAATISICGPLERFSSMTEEFSDVLLDVTRRLSQRLGSPSSNP